MMKPLSHVLLVSDMDDTLFSKDKIVSQENLNALEKFRKLGGRFTVATGRSLSSYLQYRDILKPDLPVILNNGAVIYDDDEEKVIWNTLLPESARKYVSEAIAAFPQAGVEILLSDTMYIPNMTPEIMAHIEKEHLSYREVSVEETPSHWFKVLFAMDEDVLPRFNEYLEKQAHTDVQYINSSRRYCEMLPLGSSKGQAMKTLVELFHWQDKVLCSVGDYYNDLEMIRCADIGFAVQNAPEEIQKEADIVVPAAENHPFVTIVKYLVDKYCE